MKPIHILNILNESNNNIKRTTAEDNKLAIAILKKESDSTTTNSKVNLIPGTKWVFEVQFDNGKTRYLKVVKNTNEYEYYEVDESGKMIGEVKELCNLNFDDIFESNLNESDDIQVYMNTWANYNGSKSTPESWMSVDEAKEYCKKYSEYEPFIADCDNCPLEVSEYDNASSILEELSKIEDLPSDEQEMVGYFLEDGRYKDLDTIIDKVKSGDYVFFSQVDNNIDLGKAYFDMVGIEGINNPFQYCDTKEIARELKDNDTEDFSDEEYESIAEEEVENARFANDLSYAEKYFDYEALGRDLEIDGYTYVSGGAILTL